MRAPRRKCPADAHSRRAQRSRAIVGVARLSQRSSSEWHFLYVIMGAGFAAATVWKRTWMDVPAAGAAAEAVRAAEFIRGLD